MQELIDGLKELREIDQQLVVLHTARLTMLSAREQRRTVATLRGLQRAIKGIEVSIGKLERIERERR